MQAVCHETMFLQSCGVQLQKKYNILLDTRDSLTLVQLQVFEKLVGWNLERLETPPTPGEGVGGGGRKNLARKCKQKVKKRKQKNHKKYPNVYVPLVPQRDPPLHTDFGEGVYRKATAPGPMR